eukprot:TRINITY_DN1488_c0_g1_i1.p1 TRINITY_DN1488_c0_g1~~TRINITY_DN1488_c0_g1_i1.p1  ORF type:complete len:683 (+),score=280.50 TRINITY_DN1488_c0_g1_i1:74-2122(+)
MVLQYEKTVDEIQKKTEETYSEAKSLLKGVVEQDRDKSDWISVWGRISDGLGKIHNRLWLSECMVRVGPTAEFRKAYSESSSRMKSLRTEIFADPILFQFLSQFTSLHPPSKYSNESNLSKNTLNENYKFVKDILLQLERNGSSLPADKLEEYKRISSELAKIENQFLSNIGEDVSKILFTDEELEGLPEDFVKNLKKETENGVEKNVVTMKYPHIIPVMKKAKKENVRRRAKECMDNRVGFKNVQLLRDAVIKREELAHLLGYKNWADYRLEVKMPQNSAKVEEFSRNVASKLEDLGKSELSSLLALKKKEKEERKEEFDGKIKDWDTSYYFNQLIERDFGIDDELIRKYFPFDHVAEKILGTYQKILGLRFEEIKNSDSLWNEEVKLFKVTEAKDGEFVGHFYLDLFPREGKYSHACAYPVIDGMTFFGEGEGARQYPIAVMITNFTRATDTRPSLLSHSEVKTLCHEFGHVMHNLCAKAKFSETTWLFGGMDFIECPSQMMENFIWQKEVLKEISRHYETNEPLPDELIDKMIASKNVGIGLSKLRQVMMGLFDIQIHLNGSSMFPSGDDGSALNRLWDEMRSRIALVDQAPNTNYVASWLHLCSDYDAGYYSYLWSEVFSSDLFSRFQDEGILSPKVGSDYRHLVLEPAASEGGLNLLTNFLGRPPNEQSFLKSLGVN